LKNNCWKLINKKKSEKRNKKEKKQKKTNKKKISCHGADITERDLKGPLGTSL